MNKKETPHEALEEFQFGIALTKENEEFLKEKGYEKRNGDFNHPHKFFVVLPFKKWYWGATSYYGLLVEIEKKVETSYKVKTKIKKD